MRKTSIRNTKKEEITVEEGIKENEKKVEVREQNKIEEEKEKAIKNDDNENINNENNNNENTNNENINNENINNENINNENIYSETLQLKPKNKNTKEIERSGTNANLLGNSVEVAKEVRNDNTIEEKNKDIKKKEEESQAIQVYNQNPNPNQSLNENIDYSNLPKIRNGRELTKAEIWVEDVREQEDTCDKFALRCLLFIPICFGYFFLSLFDFLTYLIVPLGFCLFYTIIFVCNYCRNIVSDRQVEEEIGFSGAFTSENEIKIHVADEGGVMHLNEILCFSYMSACVKRYFCFIFVLINHVLVPILQAWKKSKDCFIKSRIEQEYDIRMAKIEEAKQYKGYDQAETQIEINN